MDIKPTSTDSVSQNPLPPTVKPPHPGKPALQQFFVDEFRPERARQVSEALKESPEIRPEVLEKAKQFVADPNYPARAQLVKLAKMIVGDRTPLPPNVEPPDTEPPVSQPPLSEPPVSTSPMIEPPIMEPPVSAADV